MKKLQPKYYRTLCLALLSAVLLMALSACSHDDAQDYDGMPDVVDRGSYHLTLSVISSSTMGTRAGGHTDDTQEKGSAAENYIDFDGNDFRIILFDNSGNYLLELDAMDKWRMFPTLSSSSSNSYAYYQMECEIEFPESVTKESIENIKKNGLQIMVLANWKSTNGFGAYDNLFSNGSGGHQSLASIWKEGTKYNFNYTTDSGQDAQGNHLEKSWMPNHTAVTKKLIPMFGYAKAAKFNVRNNGEHIASVSIQMQRAMAKIEVLDNLVNQESLSVEDVTMTAFNNFGRYIPDVEANPNWNKVGEQVDKSSLPTVGNLTNSSKLQFFHVDGKWIVYVPEMNLGELFNANGDILESRPHLNVKIKSELSFYEGGEYTAHFAKYNDNFEPTIPDDSWKHILRNHIYRFSVNKVGVKVQLHMHVIPWYIDDDEEWDFTDHVTISQALGWDENTHDGIISENGENEVFLKLDGTVLVGSFKIATPLNGHWYARLTPLDDAKTNAVTFVDANGNIPDPSGGEPKACVDITGVIDGSEQYIYIRQTDLRNDYESRFKLDFWIENLGVWMNVPMPDGPFIIVRKGNLILRM